MYNKNKLNDIKVMVATLDEAAIKLAAITAARAELGKKRDSHIRRDKESIDDYVDDLVAMENELARFTRIEDALRKEIHRTGAEADELARGFFYAELRPAVKELVNAGRATADKLLESVMDFPRAAQIGFNRNRIKRVWEQDFSLTYTTTVGLIARRWWMELGSATSGGKGDATGTEARMLLAFEAKWVAEGPALQAAIDTARKVAAEAAAALSPGHEVEA